MGLQVSSAAWLHNIVFPHRTVWQPLTFFGQGFTGTASSMVQSTRRKGGRGKGPFGGCSRTVKPSEQCGF